MLYRITRELWHWDDDKILDGSKVCSRILQYWKGESQNIERLPKIIFNRKTEEHGAEVA